MSAQHTPGPWRWEFNGKSKSIALLGGKPQFDLTILEPCRWGMSGAGVELRDPSKEGLNLLCKLHARPDWIAAFQGRDHHKHWCADVVHPDMRLIAAAPDLLAIVRMTLAYCDKSIRDGEVSQLETNRLWEECRVAILKSETGSFVTSSRDWKSDACLYNAAPDLLAALKEVVRIADRSTSEFDAARAAIAKAEGKEAA